LIVVGGGNGGAAAKTLVTLVDSLATGFDLEAYQWRRIVAVSGTSGRYTADYALAQIRTSL